jgi:hypothetical protein
MNPLEVFGSVATPKRHYLAGNRVVWRTDLQSPPSRFCWARWQETSKTKEVKTSTKLICWPFVGGAPLIGWWWFLTYDEFPRTYWVVLSVVWSVTRFRICKGSILAFCQARPYNIASTTLQQVIGRKGVVYRHRFGDIIWDCPMLFFALKSNDGNSLEDIVLYGPLRSHNTRHSNRQRYSCWLWLFSALRIYEAVTKSYEVSKSITKSVWTFTA